MEQLTHIYQDLSVLLSSATATPRQKLCGDSNFCKSPSLSPLAPIAPLMLIIHLGHHAFKSFHYLISFPLQQRHCKYKEKGRREKVIRQIVLRLEPDKLDCITTNFIHCAIRILISHCDSTVFENSCKSIMQEDNIGHYQGRC